MGNTDPKDKGEGKEQGKTNNPKREADSSGSESGPASDCALGKRRIDIPETDQCGIHALWGLCPEAPPEKCRFGKRQFPAPPGIRERGRYFKYAQDPPRLYPRRRPSQAP